MASEHELSQRESKVVELLHEAARSERAPDSLRARLEAQREGAHQQAPRRRRRVLGLPARYAGAGGTALAALTAALVLVLGGGGAGALSIAQAATLAAGGPQGPAPTISRSSPTLLNARVGDLQFPSWVSQGGWRSTGERVDTVDGRRTVTVFYARGGDSIAYSIVASPALRGLNTHGGRYETIRQGKRTVVVWQVRNHTCLLSGVSVSVATLWQLAAITKV